MTAETGDQQPRSTLRDRVVLVTAWTLVCLPLGWGIFQTLKKALILFK